MCRAECSESEIVRENLPIGNLGVGWGHPRYPKTPLRRLIGQYPNTHTTPPSGGRDYPPPGAEGAKKGLLGPFGPKIKWIKNFAEKMFIEEI